jgi:hypothetical protein
VPPGVRILGPYTGSLDNDAESVKLRRPGEPEADGFVPLILVDRVHYRDDQPWPREADGFGPSLQKREPGLYGNDPAHWLAANRVDGSPGEDRVWAPRRWLMGYGWTQDFALVELLDEDDDGSATWKEYVAGTDPRRAGSVLALAIKQRGTGPRLDLGWWTARDRRYTLYVSDPAGHDAQPVPGAVNIPGTGGLIRIPFTLPDTSPRWFFIKAGLPEIP